MLMESGHEEVGMMLAVGVCLFMLGGSSVFVHCSLQGVDLLCLFGRWNLRIRKIFFF